MKFLIVVLLLVCAVVIQQAESVASSTKKGPVIYKITNNCNHHASNKMLLFYIKALLAALKKNQEQVPSPKLCPNRVPKNCAEVLKCGGKKSGVYSVDPDGKGQFKVYCDQKTGGGGWTVFQKRQDGSVNFYRGWTDYKNGFGNLKGEFWLGLDNIYRLTHQTSNRLRVELEDTQGRSAYAEYNYFKVSSEKTKYKLKLGTYSGTAGDSLGYHRGMAFTTKDRDNDKYSKNCAVNHKGGWWYNYCAYSGLNGLYHHGKHSSHADGVNWLHWKGYYYSAKKAEMKIRPNK